MGCSRAFTRRAPANALLRAFAPEDVLARASAHAEEKGYLSHEFGDSWLILGDAR